MKARKTAPTKTTLLSGTDQPFRVWQNNPVYQEDKLPWKCLATFYFLNECLDYIAYCQDHNADVVFQSPADVRLVKSTDRRVVWKSNYKSTLEMAAPDLLAICQEIANTKCDLLESERRIRLYSAICKAGAEL